MKVSLIPASLTLAAVLAVSCGEQAAQPEQIQLATPEASNVPAPVAEQTPIEGWQDRPQASPSLLPADFTVAQPDGAPLTADDLRGRWTILAFWGLWSEDSISDVRYMQALRSAAGQDPDLDFRAIHTPPPRTEDQQPSEAPYGAYLSLSQGLTDQGAPFPTAEDTEGEMARTLNVTSAPTYLLIGPDLAIEAKRGAIAPHSTDGIKSMIRGVAEIRSQIASP